MSLFDDVVHLEKQAKPKHCRVQCLSRGIGCLFQRCQDNYLSLYNAQDKESYNDAKKNILSSIHINKLMFSDSSSSKFNVTNTFEYEYSCTIRFVWFKLQRLLRYLSQEVNKI